MIGKRFWGDSKRHAAQKPGQRGRLDLDTLFKAPEDWDGNYSHAYGKGYFDGVGDIEHDFDVASDRGYNYGYSHGFEEGERRAQQLVLRQVHQGRYTHPEDDRQRFVGGIAALSLILSAALAVAFWLVR